MEPIVSVRNLCSRIGMRPADLRKLASQVKGYYRPFPIFDKKNKSIVRHINAPYGLLKDVQGRIRSNILAHCELGGCAHGGVVGRSPSSNAAVHLGQRCVVKLDVKEFFPSVTHGTVYRMFHHDLGFGRAVASLLTRLTTVDGQVPQGAPTSTAVANLVLAQRIDDPVGAAAERSDLRYTRFVDDVTLSGANPRPLINFVGRTLSHLHLRMHRKKSRFYAKTKLKILGRGKRQEVTGLVVNGSKNLSLSRDRRDRVRAAIFSLSLAFDDAKRAKAISSVRARIGYVRRFNPGSARRLDAYLEAVIARNL
jgi:RNA-directed DNA polymerase